MLRILIVDGEASAVDHLVDLCSRLDDLEVVGVAGDSVTALSRIKEHDPDVVLLDVSLPGLDGIALARSIATNDHRSAIIFVTECSGFAITAFELAATDYLIKPVTLQRLAQALAKARRALASGTVRPPAYLSELWAPRGREIVRIGVETLDLVEADKDYVRLHSRGQVYLLRATMQQLEKQLDPERFVRLHRSTIIPRDRINALRSDADGGWTVVLTTGRSVKVGRSFRPMVRKLIGEVGGG